MRPLILSELAPSPRCEEDATRKSPLDRVVPAMEGLRLDSVDDMVRCGLDGAEVSLRPSARLVQARGAAQPPGLDERGAGREEEEESASARKKKRTDAFLFSGEHQFPPIQRVTALYGG